MWQLGPIRVEAIKYKTQNIICTLRVTFSHRLLERKNDQGYYVFTKKTTTVSKIKRYLIILRKRIQKIMKYLKMKAPTIV
jgi:hypothetical protein